MPLGTQSLDVACFRSGGPRPRHRERERALLCAPLSQAVLEGRLSALASGCPGVLVSRAVLGGRLSALVSWCPGVLVSRAVLEGSVLLHLAYETANFSVSSALLRS